MVFSSIMFLFRFMPVAFVLYYLTPGRFKNAMLFALSLVFYSWGEVRFFPIMLISASVDYFVGRAIERNRGNTRACNGFLAISLTFSLGSLLFFKYTNFFIDNVNLLLSASIPNIGLTLPLGISFYTFQTMSYAIDVYRGKIKAEKSFINFATYVAMFPQLIAGPIVRYTDISREMKNRVMNPAQIQSGVMLFIMGLGSKVLIANNVGELWTQVEQIGFADISTALAWLGILAFSLQIYFDFSGYSLMAIGLGKMLGFHFPQNFHYPYISKSATEFWRRWHMTLGSFFREYVYLPLGGNRVSKPRQYLNIFIVWLLTGFWHGASWNFVLWGLYFCLFLCIEKTFLLKLLGKSKILAHVYLLFIVVVSWALFAITDFSQLGVFLSIMFGRVGGDDWMYYLRNYSASLILGILLATPLLRKISGKLKDNYAVQSVFAAVVLLLSVAYLVDSTYNPFLYFRF
ncbi:MAG: MBOAT family protein [Oscillospiraceae bacterium]|nr:MBOAT family protein [Oscillospiraceae bacterium]